MIDYQNEIFTKVATAVRSDHEGATVTGEYTRSPSEFPTVTLDEIENVTVASLVDSSDEESFCGLGYRLQVFSNKVGGRQEIRSSGDFFHGRQCDARYGVPSRHLLHNPGNL